MSADILNLGGIITKLIVPNVTREPTNVVLCYEDPEQYLSDSFYLGGIIGRFANRIKIGQFELEGETYQLATNNGGHHLHGGNKGFNKVFWEVKDKTQSSITLFYRSEHMEEGYPGNLDVTVKYTLTDTNQLVIDYHATTDQTTIINLTNHSYFNLSGDPDHKVLDHQLKIYADSVIEVDQLIPTGQLLSTKDTALDFHKPKALGASVYAPELKDAFGYDNCYVFQGEGLKTMAELTCPSSGITLTASSTEPSMQLYTANYLTEPFQNHAGVCLETQHFPDSPNHVHFPSTILTPDQAFESQTIYAFGVVN